jgi:hypothetical protein
VIFDISHLVAVIALSLIMVRSKLAYNIQVLLVLLFLLIIMMIVPLRLPHGIITNGPDMIYQLQVMNSIAATGAISFTSPTRFALAYVFTPMQETLLVMVGSVLGTPIETPLKYGGPLFGVLTVVFLLGFYRAFLPKKEALIAAFLAGNCSWFLQASTVHETLALVFLSLAIYSLTKSGVAWRLLTVLSALAIVSTHEFTAIVGSTFFALAALMIVILSRWLWFKRGPIENLMLKMPVLLMTWTFAWLTFVALPFFGSTIGVVGLVAGALLSGSARAAFPLTVGNSVPNSFDRLVGDIGVVSFAVACVSGSLAILGKRENSQYQQLLPYAAGSALIFFVGLISYLKFNQATDLLSRGFIYVYFFSAPIALYTILKISSALRKEAVIRQTVGICLILMIAVAGVYYQYPRYAIDNTAKENIEDVRFPLYQWQAAGYFVLGHDGGSIMWGDKIAFDYVGGYGDRNVNIFDNTLNLTLSEWISAVPSSSDIVILRQTMPVVPYGNYVVTSQGLHEILVTHDIIYSSGEVDMIIVS